MIEKVKEIAIAIIAILFGIFICTIPYIFIGFSIGLGVFLVYKFLD